MLSELPANIWSFSSVEVEYRFVNRDPTIRIIAGIFQWRQWATLYIFSG